MNMNPVAFVEQMMRNGTRGTEIKASWFVDLRERYALPYIFASFGILTIVSVPAFSPLGSLFVALMVIAAWLLVVYSYVAIGTMMSHGAAVAVGFLGFVILGLESKDYFSAMMIMSGIPGGSIFTIRMLFYGMFALLFLGIGVLVLVGWRKQAYARTY